MANETKKEHPTKIDTYKHDDKSRTNNPPSGLVNLGKDRDGKPKTFKHDPHIDPHMSWAGKAERMSFEVPTLSLHIHETIDPHTIIEAVRKPETGERQVSLFDLNEARMPINRALDFYKHEAPWTNRIIAGDNLRVMNSLLHKENMGRKVQTIYMDPPYGIKYRSNFQTNTDRSRSKSEELTNEPEQIRAFRDTWEFGVHSYLNYLRDRLLLCRELLKDEGSCFVQIGYENVHRVAMLMDEIFGAHNRVSTISYATTGSTSANLMSQVADYILWYAKDKDKIKHNLLFEDVDRTEKVKLLGSSVRVELPNGDVRGLTPEEKEYPDGNLPPKSRLFRRMRLTSQHESNTGRSEDYHFDGRTWSPGDGQQWRISKEGMDKLGEMGRLFRTKTDKSLDWIKYEDEYPGKMISNMWSSTMAERNKRYVVQTSTKVIERIVLMTSDPGDLVFDPTCGSGATAHVAEQWGRRWITCDTSRVAINVAKKALMTSMFKYYNLRTPDKGVGGGFVYETAKTVSAKILSSTGEPEEINLYDRPKVDNKTTRVSGPFTVEAVPAPHVEPIRGDNDSLNGKPGRDSLIRQWRDEIETSGIKVHGGNRLRILNIEDIVGKKFLHARGDVFIDNVPNGKKSTKGGTISRLGTVSNGESVIISFGHEHQPLGSQHVVRALKEMKMSSERAKHLVFAAFQFDSEAQLSIQEANLDDLTVHCVSMNSDLQTDDLKKAKENNESFWLIGTPEIKRTLFKEGVKKGKCQIEVLGFDYFNFETGKIESGGPSHVAMWMLDTNYNERSLFPRQVFFPMATQPGGWKDIEKALKATIDPDLMSAFRGNVSIPFNIGDHKRAAVKIIDKRGIESMKVIDLD